MPFDAMESGPPSDAVLLRTARSLIDNASFWTQGVYSRNLCYGYTARCAVMALSVACGSGSRVPSMRQRRLARLLVQEMPHHGGIFGRWLPACGRLIMFNDSPLTTHRDVMHLFDRAIARQAIQQASIQEPVYV